MNNKLFSFALLVGLLATSHANAWKREEATAKGQQETVTTLKGEQLTGQWLKGGKYFQYKTPAGEIREIHVKGIKKEGSEAAPKTMVKSKRSMKAAQPEAT